jgi:hypothetical protein
MIFVISLDMEDLAEYKKTLDNLNSNAYNMYVMPIMGHTISTCYKEKRYECIYET